MAGRLWGLNATPLRMWGWGNYENVRFEIKISAEKNKNMFVVMWCSSDGGMPCPPMMPLSCGEVLGCQIVSRKTSGQGRGK
jgi:hypothetical protein